MTNAKTTKSRKGSFRFLRLLLLYLIALLFPFALFFAAAGASGNVYSESFTAALADKYDLLNGTEGQKLVLIGGSSLPFGIRGDLMEEHLRVHSVDMGVYAALGTKVMLEISLDGISAGDVVVLAPELSAQTYSSYFNAEIFWEAAYERPEMISKLDWEEKSEMLLRYFAFSAERILHRNDAKTGTGSLYARSSFDENGDLAYPHSGNVMAGGWDVSQPISLDGLLTEDFFDTVVPFLNAAKAKGADVFFSFSPTNRSAKKFSDADEAAFLAELKERLPCGILGTPSDMTYGKAYFYNTNYHLNETGAVLHTKTLLELLLSALGLPSDTGIAVPEIPAGERPEPDPVPGDEITDKSFRFTYAGGVYYLAEIFGDAASGKTVRLPETYHGQAVEGLESGAFRNCSAMEILYVPSCYTMFPPGLFESCPSLTEIHLSHTEPGSVSVPVEGMFDGASPDLSVYLPAEAYTKFASDYSWRIYRSYFKKESGGN